jgi:hypothetical protein
MHDLWTGWREERAPNSRNLLFGTMRWALSQTTVSSDALMFCFTNWLTDVAKLSSRYIVGRCRENFIESYITARPIWHCTSWGLRPDSFTSGNVKNRSSPPSVLGRSDHSEFDSTQATREVHVNLVFCSLRLSTVHSIRKVQLGWRSCSHWDSRKLAILTARMPNFVPGQECITVECINACTGTDMLKTWSWVVEEWVTEGVDNFFTSGRCWPTNYHVVLLFHNDLIATFYLPKPAKYRVRYATTLKFRSVTGQTINQVEDTRYRTKSRRRLSSWSINMKSLPRRGNGTWGWGMTRQISRDQA